MKVKKFLCILCLFCMTIFLPARPEVEPVEQAEQVTQQAQTQPTKIKFPLKIPHLHKIIGTLDLEGEFNITDQSFSMEVSFEGKPKIEVIPELLTLAAPTVQFSNTKGLVITAKTKLFGIESTVGLQKLVLGSHVIFGIKPVKPIKLQVTPWKAIEVEELGLYLSEKEQKLFVDIDFFSRDGKPNATLEFGLEAVWKNLPKKQANTGLAQLTQLEKKESEENIETDETQEQRDQQEQEVADPKRKRILYARIAVSDLPLSGFIPQVKGTPFDTALQNAEIKIAGPFKKENRSALVQGSINLESLSEVLPGVQLGNLTTRAFIDDEGFTFKTGLGFNIPLIPTLTSLKNPALILTTRPDDMLDIQNETQSILSKEKKSKPSLTLSGEVEFNVPPDLGTINAKLASTFSTKGFRKLDGIIENNLDFQGIPLKNARIQIWKDPPKAQLSTTAVLQGMDVTANVAIEKPKTKAGVAKKKKEFGVSFWGELADQKPIIPFQGLGDPLDKIKISDLKLGLKTTPKPLFFIEGTTSIMGLGLTAGFQSSPKGITVFAKTPDDFTLSSIVPDVEGTFIDDLKLPNVQIIASSTKTRIDDVPIKKGINIVTELSFKPEDLPLNEKQKKLYKIIKSALFLPSGITLAGSIGPSLTDLAVQALINLDIDFRKLPGMDQLPPDLKFLKPPIRLANFGFELLGDGPSFGLFGEVELFPPGQEDPLLFVSKGKIDPDSVNIAGSMLGEWDLWWIERLCNLKLAVSDTALELGWDLKISQQLAAATVTIGGVGALIPSIFGITGTIQIGKAKAKAAVKVSGTNVTDYGLHAKLNRLTLGDIVEQMSKTFKFPMPKDGIPELGIYNAEILASIKGAMIGEVSIPPGFKIKGELKLLDKFALVDMGLSTDGLTCRGTFPEINIGPLLVSGKGLDDRDQKGPALDIELSLKRQIAMLTGLVKFFGAESETYFYLGKKGINFFTKTKFFDLFEIELKGRSSGSGKNLDFIIEALIKNDLMDNLVKAITKLNEEAQKKLSKAQADVKKLDNDIARIDEQIRKKDTEMAQLKKIIDKKTVEARKKADDAARKLGLEKLDKALEKEVDKVGALQKKIRGTVDRDLTNAQREVDKLSNEIARLEKRRNYCHNAPWWRADLKAEWTGITTVAIPAVWISHKIAWNTLQVIRDINKRLPSLDEIRNAVETTIFDPSSLRESIQYGKLDIEKIDLQNRKQVVLSSKEQTLFHLGNISAISDFATEAFVDMSQTTIRNMIQIREAYLRGSLKEFFSEGKLPLVTLKMDILEKKGVEGAFQIDLKDPNKFFDSVAKFLVEVFTVQKKAKKTA